MIITVSVVASILNISAVMPRFNNIHKSLQNSKFIELVLKQKPKQQKPVRERVIIRTFKNSV